MDDFIRGVYYSGRYWRLASLVTIICVVISFPQTGWSFTNGGDSLTEDFFLKVDLEDFDRLDERFNSVETSINESGDSIGKSRDFLLSFIAQMNARYGLSVTPQEACNLVKTNLHLLQLSSEEKASLLMAIDLLEKGRSTMTITVEEMPAELPLLKANRHFNHLYWPWEWNWFGWNKDKNRHHSTQGNLVCSIKREVEVELPGNCYFGACEAFAGALLCIIPHPVAWSTGLTMIFDGGRRVIDGVIQLSDERRLDPNFVPPKPPF